MKYVKRIRRSWQRLPAPGADPARSDPRRTYIETLSAIVNGSERLKLGRANEFSLALKSHKFCASGIVVDKTQFISATARRAAPAVSRPLLLARHPSREYKRHLYI